jgi:hypothetical protein
MAEAVYHGKASNAFFAGSAIANCVGWSINLSADVADSSVMGTAVGKTAEAGFLSGTAQVTCHLPGDRAITEGSKGVLELLRTALNADGGYASDTDGAICTGVEPGVDKDGIESLTYNFQLTGEVSNTVTEGGA